MEHVLPEDEMSVDLASLNTPASSDAMLKGDTGPAGMMGQPCNVPGDTQVDVDVDDTLPVQDDIQLDNLFEDPRISKVIEPYGELVDLLHVTHGDQMTIADLVGGINEGRGDSAETELFREMIRLKGAPAAMEWLAATQQSINHMSYQNGLTDTVMRENSQWLQGILIDGRVKGGYRPGINNSNHSKGARLTGREAMIRVRQELKVGDFITFPMPHTGIWATILVAGEDEMLNFHTRVLAAKSVLGRRTAGLVFSNSEVIVLRHLWDLLSGMIVNTSMGKVNKKELTSLVKIQDIPLMVGYYMAARFRSGYNLAQACQVDPAKCGHVEVQRVNINRLMIIDNARLTEAQRGHMRKQSNHDVNSVLAYQEYFSAIRDNVVNITPGVRVVFGAPSVEQNLQAGTAWLDAIEDAVTLSFKDELTREERVNYINKQAALSALRNYAHWVRRIDYLDSNGEVDGFIEGDEDIYSQLAELSKDETFKEAFYKEINTFMNDMTIGIIALPRYKCPACQGRQPAVNDKFPNYTPINMNRAFFTLLANTLNSSIASADI